MNQQLYTLSVVSGSNGAASTYEFVPAPQMQQLFVLQQVSGSFDFVPVQWVVQS